MRAILSLAGRLAERNTRCAVGRVLALEEMMRTNSGRDESRNNLRDPTLRDQERGRKQAMMTGRTTGMGSNARKTGQRGG
jgi:hypothetical protein